MGTYELPVEKSRENVLGERERTINLLHQLSDLGNSPATRTRLVPILLGADAENNEEVFWNPDPDSGSPNPHVLVLGESGFGKTYTIACLLAELAQQYLLSVVLDYGQGFSLGALPPEFLDATNPVELQVSLDGIDINPLQIFPSDMHGPVNVAQRLADTFARVYPRIGVQQHAVLRQRVLDVMADEAIVPEDTNSWGRDLPAFRNVQHKLLSYANNPNNPHSRFAASVASHISTLFVFNTFRPNGQKLAWTEMMEANSRVVIIQLKGLEYSLERAVTEFLLWNLIGYIEALGPSPLRCFIVLDEAHKLSFDQGSPVESSCEKDANLALVSSWPLNNRKILALSPSQIPPRKLFSRSGMRKAPFLDNYIVKSGIPILLWTFFS
jgi:hypothetical protein